jgi:NADPH2 dehydrogenase
MPQALSIDGIQNIVSAFVAAARRACEAGFRVIEVHTAHGYMIHESVSPAKHFPEPGHDS